MPAMSTEGLPTNIRDQLRTQERELLIRGQRLGRFNKIRQREFYSSYLFAVGQGGVITANKYPVFTSIKGDQGQGYASAMTERETNWLQRNRLADNHNLLIKAFHVEIKRGPTDQRVYPPEVKPFQAKTGFVDTHTPPHPADVQALAYGALLGIQYLTNLVPLGYLADFPSPGGVYGFTEASHQMPTLANDGQSGTLIDPATGNKNRAQLPITRNAVQPFLERRAKVSTLLQHGENFSMAIIVPQPIRLLDTNPAAANGAEVNDVSGCLEVRVGFWATESFVEAS